MVVIVGHGPSIVGSGIGPWLDSQTVVRLKAANIPNPDDWGTRTDYVGSYYLDYRRDGIPFLWFPKPGDRRELPNVRRADADRWRRYYAKFSPTYKPSTGLAILFAVVELLKPERIALAGFDNLLRPQEKGYTKWTVGRYVSTYRHDAQAEHDCAMSLGVPIVDAITEAQCLTSSTTTP